eukprot:TRINITY_DN1241_c10_g1_i1.p1 TRINITY_DN1241_c10_g1~~TRINITY_DN1241_c10_g1_i1.p1  ORF type:complete len:2343 (+),score=635.01 TRINITY_DN1241_c10_g1_i1:1039-7029(+)
MPEQQRDQLRRIADANAARAAEADKRRSRDARLEAYDLWTEGRAQNRGEHISAETSERSAIRLEEDGEWKDMRSVAREETAQITRRQQRKERQADRRNARGALEETEEVARADLSAAIARELVKQLGRVAAAWRATAEAEEERARRGTRRQYFSSWTEAQRAERARLRMEHQQRVDVDADELVDRAVVRGLGCIREALGADAVEHWAIEEGADDSVWGDASCQDDTWGQGFVGLKAEEVAHREWVYGRDDQRRVMVLHEERWRRQIEADHAHTITQISDLRHVTEARRNLQLLVQRREEENREQRARSVVEEAEEAEWAIVVDILQVFRPFLALCRRNAVAAQERLRRLRRAPRVVLTATDRAPVRYYLSQPECVGKLEQGGWLRVRGDHIAGVAQMPAGWVEGTQRVSERERELWRQQEQLASRARAAYARHAAALATLPDLNEGAAAAVEVICGNVGKKSDDLQWDQATRPVKGTHWPPADALAETKMRIWGGYVEFKIEPPADVEASWEEELWHPHTGVPTVLDGRRSISGLVAARLPRTRALSNDSTNSPDTSQLGSPLAASPDLSPLHAGPGVLRLAVPTDGTFTMKNLHQLLADLRYRARLKPLADADVPPTSRRISCELKLRFASAADLHDGHMQSGRRNIPTSLVEVGGSAELDVVVCSPFLTLPPDSDYSWRGGAADAERPMFMRVKVCETPFISKVGGTVEIRPGRPGLTDFDRGLIVVRLTSGRTSSDGVMLRPGGGVRVRTDGVILCRNAPFASVRDAQTADNVSSSIPRKDSVAPSESVTPRASSRSRSTFFSDGEERSLPASLLKAGAAGRVDIALTGESATADNLRRLLERLRFHNSSSDPVLGLRTVMVTVYDEAGYTCSAEVSVQVEAKDDPTELIVPRKSLTFHASPGVFAEPDRTMLHLFREATLVDPDTEHFIGGHLAVRLGAGRQKGEGLQLRLPSVLTLGEAVGDQTGQEVAFRGHPIGTLVLVQPEEGESVGFFTSGPGLRGRRGSLLASPTHADAPDTAGGWFASKGSFRGAAPLPSVVPAHERTAVYTVVGIKFNSTGEATIKAAETFLRSVCFLSALPSPSTATVRMVDVALQVGPACRKRTVDGGVTGVSGDPPLPWEMQDEARESVSVKITPPVLSVGARLNTLKYREGSGAQRLAAFDVMHEQYGEAWDGGWLQADITDGFAPSLDQLNLREQDGIRIELRDWIDSDSDYGTARITPFGQSFARTEARQSDPEMKPSSRLAVSDDWFGGGGRSPCITALLADPSRRRSTSRMPSARRQTTPHVDRSQVAPLLLPTVSIRQVSEQSEEDRKFAKLNALGQAMTNIHPDFLGGLADKVSSPTTGDLAATPSRTPPAPMHEQAEAPALCRLQLPDEGVTLLTSSRTTMSPGSNPEIDIADAVSVGSGPLDTGGFTDGGMFCREDTEPFQLKSRSPPHGKRGSLSEIVRGRMPGAVGPSSGVFGGPRAAHQFANSFAGGKKRPRSRTQPVEGQQSVSDVFIDGRFVGILLLDGFKGRLSLHLASSERGQPLVRRRDVTVLLRNLTYLSVAAKAAVPQKSVRVLASTSYFTANASSVSVGINIEAVDDLTEVLLRDEVVVYRCGAPPQCIAPLNQARLWDPDTVHFDGGHLTVELISGVEKGDELALLCREEQLKRVEFEGSDDDSDTGGRRMSGSLARGLPFPGRRGSTVDYVIRKPQRFVFTPPGEGQRRLTMACGAEMIVTYYRQGSGLKIAFPTALPGKEMVHIDCVTYLLNCVTFYTNTAGGGRRPRPSQRKSLPARVGKEPAQQAPQRQRLIQIRISDGSNPYEGKAKLTVDVVPPRLQLPVGQTSVPASAGVPFTLAPRVIVAEDRPSVVYTCVTAEVHPSGIAELHWSIPAAQAQVLLDAQKALRKDPGGRVVSADGAVVVVAAQDSLDQLRFDFVQGRISADQLCTLLRCVQLTPRVAATGRKFEVRIDVGEVAPVVLPGAAPIPPPPPLSIAVRVAGSRSDR